MTRTVLPSTRRGLGRAAVAAAVVAAMVAAAPRPAAADVVTGTNAAAVAVPAGGTSQGVASPYPSSITVSGVTGTVSDVNVTLTSVTHAIATDMDVLLVGPAGQNLLMMSDVKGDSGFSVNGTLTFDDQATAQIPATRVTGTGTFQPTNRVD